MKRILQFGVCLTALSCAWAAAGSEECGRLDSQSRFDDVNQIVACLEARIMAVDAGGLSPQGVERNLRARADREHRKDGLYLVGQGCKKGKNSYECRVFLRNNNAEAMLLGLNAALVSVTNEAGDSFAAGRISFQAQQMGWQFDAELLAGEGSNAIVHFYEMPAAFKPLTLRFTVLAKDTDTYIKSLLSMAD